MQRETIEQVAHWMAESASTITLTGAGISTESGIPDFRSPNGVWATSTPVYFQDYLASEAARIEYWRQKSQAHADFAAAQPNRCHQILANWESCGHLGGVITQNIDGLHQIAGSRNVRELHGTARDVACLNCDWRDQADRFVADFLQTHQVPNCPDCGGLIKHATISFGQNLSATTLQESAQWAANCDLFLAMGTSLVVSPASELPVIAHDHGARLIILNREDTPLDALADLVLRGELGATLAMIDSALQRLRSAAPHRGNSQYTAPGQE